MAQAESGSLSPTRVAPVARGRTEEDQHVTTAFGTEEDNHAKAAAMGSEADQDREPSMLTQFLLCCVSAIEGADTQLLGASMKALQSDVGVTLMDISYMTMAQLVFTNIAAPFWGILADRGVLNRKTILMIGACGQGLITFSLSFSSNVTIMILLRACVGLLLAALRPISNGIIADTTSENKRGKIFGRVQSALLFGMFVTTMSVVPVATETVLGHQGWRIAFCFIGCISLTVTLMLGFLMTAPPINQTDGLSGCGAVAAEISSLGQFFKIPTFCVMIMQGIFGTIPWSVMGYMVLFFQLTGIANEQVAVLSGCGPVTGAFGNIIGGIVADFLAKRFHLNGRPLSAQITVAFGIPLIYAMFYGVPPGQGSFSIYLSLNIAFGLLGSWAQSGTNFPILSHIVPSTHRSRVMAWECALENSIANAIGPLVVSTLANANGYRFGENTSGDVDLHSARALGKALTATICIPWAICFVAYSTLHWSYPRDVRRLELQARLAKESALASKKAEELETHAV